MFAHLPAASRLRAWLGAASRLHAWFEPVACVVEAAKRLRACQEPAPCVVEAAKRLRAWSVQAKTGENGGETALCVVSNHTHSRFVASTTQGTVLRPGIARSTTNNPGSAQLAGACAPPSRLATRRKNSQLFSRLLPTIALLRNAQFDLRFP